MSPTGVRMNLSAHAKLSLSSESDPLKCELEKKVSYLESELDIGSQCSSPYSTTTTITINNNKLEGGKYPGIVPTSDRKGFLFNLPWWRVEREPKGKLRFNPCSNSPNIYSGPFPTVKKWNLGLASETTGGAEATFNSISSTVSNLINGFWKWNRKFAPCWEFLIFPSEFHYVARVIIMTIVTVIVLHRTALSINYKQILESFHLDEAVPPGVVAINSNLFN